MGAQFMGFTRKSDHKSICINVDHLQAMIPCTGHEGGTELWLAGADKPIVVCDDFNAIGKRTGWGRRHD